MVLVSTVSNNVDKQTQPTALGLVASRWVRGLVWLPVLVCFGAGNASAQARTEGGAVATAGANSTVAKEPGSANLPIGSVEDIMEANRRALEARAGHDAAKLMLRSAPNGARVQIDGRVVGKTPLLLIVAPGVYKVEMEGPHMEFGQKQVDLFPKETREVVLALESRYPTHIELSWHPH